MRYPEGLRKEAELAEKMHWKLILGGGGHLKWFDENGQMRLSTSMTPHKGKRAIENARSRLKKYGIKA